ncbi:hypothetical protein EEW87_17370 [Janibacter melonis]|uniref:Uncharacterized protein n=1 Tax=Janibacter melonis TaxID=262209 RepID=A0A650GFC4_9MICO|nr:hypothetical protein [Janibacter melonis]QGX08691.1 hypothetical protein EEW87_17370 [Janibacter melonis]
MSKAMKWLVASFVLMGALQLSRIWWQGEAAVWVNSILTVAMFACTMTAFFTWFKDTQR